MFKGIRALYLIPVGIYLVAACLLYMLILHEAGHYDVDSYGYVSIAHYFVQTGVLTDPHNTSSPPVQPVGYPFFLALVLWIFGSMLPSVVIVQSLCACLIIVATIHVARSLYGDLVAWSTGLLCAGNVGYFIYAQLLLAEIVLVSMLSLFVVCYCCFLKTRHMQALVQAGLLLGTSMLIKPVALFFIIPLACITAVGAGKAQRMRSTLYLLIAFCVPIAAYMGRNYLVYERLFFAPMAQLNIYQCLLAKVISDIECIPQQEVIQTRLRFASTSLADDAGWQQAQAYFYWYLISWPHVFMRIWFTNVIKTWCGLYVTQLKRMTDIDRSDTHSFFNQQGTLLQRMWTYTTGATDHTWVRVLCWYELWYTCVRLLGACLGLWVLYARRQFTYLALYISMMVSFSLVTGMDGSCRYRMTYESVLLLLAAIGFAYIVSRYQHSIKEYTYGVI